MSAPKPIEYDRDYAGDLCALRQQVERASDALLHRKYADALTAVVQVLIYAGGIAAWCRREVAAEIQKASVHE